MLSLLRYGTRYLALRTNQCSFSNAGYFYAHRSVDDPDLEDYWWSFEINVRNGVILIQGFLETKPKTGAILINISSGTRHLPYFPYFSA